MGILGRKTRKLPAALNPHLKENCLRLFSRAVMALMTGIRTLIRGILFTFTLQNQRYPEGLAGNPAVKLPFAACIAGIGQFLPPGRDQDFLPLC